MPTRVRFLAPALAPLLLLATSFAPRAARAAEATAARKAILLVDGGPGVKGDDVAAIGAAFAVALEQFGFGVVGEDFVAAHLSGRPDLRKCLEKRPHLGAGVKDPEAEAKGIDCMFDLAGGTNADLVVEAVITHEPPVAATREPAPTKETKGKKGSKAAPTKETPGSPEKWDISLRLLPLDVRRPGADGQGGCVNCQREAPDGKSKSASTTALALLSDTLKTELKQRPRATLKVHSTPTGAAVRMDGYDLGVTDLKRTIYAGEGHLEVSLGDKKVEQSIKAEAERVVELDADLNAGTIKERQDVVIPPPPPPAKWMRPVGVALMVAGVAMAATGGGLWSINGNPTGCEIKTPGQHCPERFATQNLGIGLIASGTAVAVVGIVLTAKGWPKKTEHKLSIAPLVGPGALGLGASGQF